MRKLLDPVIIFFILAAEALLRNIVRVEAWNFFIVKFKPLLRLSFFYEWVIVTWVSCTQMHYDALEMILWVLLALLLVVDGLLLRV